jgi:chromosomal replication initiator protein
MSATGGRKNADRAALASERRTAAPPSPKSPRRLELRGFLTLPENLSAVQAVSGLLQAVLLGRRPRVPLIVLHGQPGSGKTRLVDAALEALALASPESTARSIPARELVWSDGELGFAADPDLLACDLLVLEDVQHLPRSASGALCSLIDEREARRRALIITGSTGPAQLTHLPRRLTSRLAAGLVIQLEPLGRESRRAIIVASAGRVKLAPDALDWLAGQGSLRTALGMLQNLALVVAAQPGPLDRKAVEKILAESGHPTSRTTVLPAIIQRVCATFEVTRKELLGPSRLRRVLLPRQVAMYLAQRSGKLSLPRIGAAFDRDHTTVMHACRKVEAAVKSDAKLNGVVRQLKKELE